MMEVGDAAIQRDLVYKRVNGAVLTLDLYCPEKVSGSLPVIVWIHGGGWRSGRKERVSSCCSGAGRIRRGQHRLPPHRHCTLSGADRRL